MVANYLFCSAIRGVVRVARQPTERAPYASRELAQVDLREHNRPGVTQLLHDEGVVRGQRPLQHDGAGRGREVRRVDVVLQDQRDAMQGGAGTPGLPEMRPNGETMANTFQGVFPVEDTGADGYEGTSPVRQYPPNGYGPGSEALKSR